MKYFHWYEVFSDWTIFSGNKKITYKETSSSLLVYLKIWNRSSAFSVKSIIWNIYWDDKKYHNPRDIENIDWDIFNNSINNLALKSKKNKDICKIKEWEEWKSYENLEVSNFWRVRNLKNVILKPIIIKKWNYHYVELKEIFSWQRRRVSLPLIVFMLFRKDKNFISISWEIIHKDWNKANNHINNLEYKSKI